MPRQMPLLLGFLLVALFIWQAENLATFAHAWIYPHQAHGLATVPPAKLGAWWLLTIISFVVVSFAPRRELGGVTAPLRSGSGRGYLPASPPARPGA